MLIRSHVKLFQVCLANMPESFVRSIANFTPPPISGDSKGGVGSVNSKEHNVQPSPDRRRRIHFKLGKSCDVMSNGHSWAPQIDLVMHKGEYFLPQKTERDT